MRGKFEPVKVLIVDDNRQIVSILTEYAKKEGYAVDTAVDGAEALTKESAGSYDVILLDVMLPHKDGFEVCREIRRRSSVPVIMITARDEDYERIMGLDIGADDYVVKPFSPGEVMARIRAVLRRINKEAARERIFRFDNLMIDLNDYTATVNGQSVSLTKKEFEILWTLATNENRVFSRDNLLDQLWGHDYFGGSRTVDSHIKRLRSKLKNAGTSDWEIKTIWGVGYKFETIANP
jgi:DNA-binding response OmpR family regulator